MSKDSGNIDKRSKVKQDGEYEQKIYNEYAFNKSERFRVASEEMVYQSKSHNCISNKQKILNAI